jgi:hypothetical protein
VESAKEFGACVSCLVCMSLANLRPHHPRVTPLCAHLSPRPSPARKTSLKAGQSRIAVSTTFLRERLRTLNEKLAISNYCINPAPPVDRPGLCGQHKRDLWTKIPL